MLLPYGVGTLLFKTVPFARTVSMRVVLNAKQTKLMKDNHAWCHGALAIMHIILTASVDGPVKRKIHVLYVRRLGQQ